MAGGLFAASSGRSSSSSPRTCGRPICSPRPISGRPLAPSPAAAPDLLSIFRAAARSRQGSRPAAARDRAQPHFIVAVACGVASYALMNLVMTSAPLAMVDCGHSVAERRSASNGTCSAMYRAELLHRLA